MGEAQNHIRHAKLFFGLLSSSESVIQLVKTRLSTDFSGITLESESLEFGFTKYYESEMGSSLLRQWICTSRPIELRELVSIKLYTNRLENLYAENGSRRVNIDPGYVTLSKVVLGTTKDYSHRIYVGRGIFEEVTLHYKRGSGFDPWPWTYPDYRSDTANAFFMQVREQFKADCSKGEPALPK